MEKEAIGLSRIMLSCNYLQLLIVHPQIMPPFYLDEIHPSCTYPSSQHSFYTSMLMAIPQQFRYIRPLLPINGRIRDRITCSTWFDVLTNCLYFLTMAFIPSLSTSFVPTCTKTDPPLPETHGVFYPLNSSSSPCSLAGWGPSHLIASSIFIVNVLHFPLFSAVIFHSWPFVPALSRSRLTQSFHRSFGLPLLLLPPSSAFHALFDSLSSPILCTCPVHLILLPATFIFRWFFMPISSLNSLIFLLSSWVTLHI